MQTKTLRLLSDGRWVDEGNRVYVLLSETFAGANPKPKGKTEVELKESADAARQRLEEIFEEEFLREGTPPEVAKRMAKVAARGNAYL